MKLQLVEFSSFRDPDGYVFKDNGVYYRYVAPSYKGTYEKFMRDGLYDELIKKNLLISHVDCTHKFDDLEQSAIILCPEQLECLTYPYEWSFTQLKQAALCTLDIFRTAMSFGFTLKDASAYNLTWHNGKMIFFDTLSFTPYKEGEPWAGYRQFCQHFLAPLALMAYKDMRLNSLLLKYIDGIPLDLTSKLLPFKTKLKPSLILHIHAHAALQTKYADSRKKIETKIKRKTVINLIESLTQAIEGFKLPYAKTEWGNYYNDTNYSDEQATQKREIIEGWLSTENPAKILDLGANDGTYSRIAKKYTPLVLSLDIDPIAVDINTKRCMDEKETGIIPILCDITTPTPAIGWGLKERACVFDRVKCDLGMALALVHHLAIGNNVSLEKVFSLLSEIAPKWIIEFVDKKDSQVQRLLCNRPDIFSFYTEEYFEKAALERFDIIDKKTIEGTHRTMYLASERKK